MVPESDCPGTLIQYIAIKPKFQPVFSLSILGWLKAVSLNVVLYIDPADGALISSVRCPWRAFSPIAALVATLFRFSLIAALRPTFTGILIPPDCAGPATFPSGRRPLLALAAVLGATPPRTDRIIGGPDLVESDSAVAILVELRKCGLRAYAEHVLDLFAL